MVRWGQNYCGAVGNPVNLASRCCAFEFTKPANICSSAPRRLATVASVPVKASSRLAHAAFIHHAGNPALHGVLAIAAKAEIWFSQS